MVRQLLTNKFFAFFLFVLVIVAVMALFFPEGFRPSEDARLREVLNCDLQRVSPNVLSLRLKEADDIDLIISMHSQPDDQTIADFAAEGVTLYPSTWIFDYLVGSASHEEMCFLATDDRVSYVDLAP